MLFNFVIDLLKKPLLERTESESNTICQWLIQNFRIFSKIQSETVDDIVSNSRLLECNENSLLIKQNELGSTFFIILNGTVSIYINTDLVNDPDEERINSASNSKTSPKREKTDYYPKVTDRNKYGNFIGNIETGGGFGEMALISDDVRNATIISETKSQFLVLDKAVYNRSLRKNQEAEFQAFNNFVNNSPIFYNWALRYKKQVAMSLRRQTFPFETEIIKQGDKINGIGFIVEGQAKVIMDITQHSQQYPDLNITDYLNQTKSVSVLQNELLIQSLEKVKKVKHLELSLVGPGEIIGDIEHAFGLETSCKTITPIENTEVYFLSEKNYERLLTSKKNQTTAEMLNKWAEQKLLSQFLRPAYQQIPLIGCLVKSIINRKLKTESQKLENEPKKISITKQQDFISRGPLIDMYGPGTVFYRNRLLREKMKTKRSKSNDQKSKSQSGNEIKFDEKPNNSGNHLDQDPTFLDWETSSNKLENLENNIESWLNSDSTSIKSTVPKLRRFVKKENEIVRPGKTILLKPKKFHKLTDIVMPTNSNFDSNIHKDFDISVNAIIN